MLFSVWYYHCWFLSLVSSSLLCIFQDHIWRLQVQNHIRPLHVLLLQPWVLSLLDQPRKLLSITNIHLTGHNHRKFEAYLLPTFKQSSSSFLLYDNSGSWVLNLHLLLCTLILHNVKFPNYKSDVSISSFKVVPSVRHAVLTAVGDRGNFNICKYLRLSLI